LFAIIVRPNARLAIRFSFAPGRARSGNGDKPSTWNASILIVVVLKHASRVSYVASAQTKPVHLIAAAVTTPLTTLVAYLGGSGTDDCDGITLDFPFR
jgi:hypothetical protein